MTRYSNARPEDIDLDTFDVSIYTEGGQEIPKEDVQQFYEACAADPNYPPILVDKTQPDRIGFRGYSVQRPCGDVEAFLANIQEKIRATLSVPVKVKDLGRDC